MSEDDWQPQLNSPAQGDMSERHPPPDQADVASSSQSQQMSERLSWLQRRAQIKEKQNEYATGVCLSDVIGVVVLFAFFVAFNGHLIGSGAFMIAMSVDLAMMAIVHVTAYVMAKRAEDIY
ncbi:hypothetical protein [Thermogemmatispora tikiterensis]|uniref:Uncharacterized protein n=1 Tax=Thermogemmatispora tikiterensis TaxID=1825093 RepID=A0A328V903_9CHLR|nr:hypothetical protein [Thermogemmatispora tikiterensis]RAQ94028.1 hypothetical protein A4R35_00690 [Thermogemmatispora tikiterensis]